MVSHESNKEYEMRKEGIIYTFPTLLHTGIIELTGLREGCRTERKVKYIHTIRHKCKIILGRFVHDAFG